MQIELRLSASAAWEKRYLFFQRSFNNRNIIILIEITRYSVTWVGKKSREYAVNNQKSNKNKRHGKLYLSLDMSQCIVNERRQHINKGKSRYAEYQ